MSQRYTTDRYEPGEKYPRCDCVKQAERVRVLREALDGLLLSHPHANDGMHGYSVIVTTDQVLACRSARAALEATK